MNFKRQSKRQNINQLRKQEMEERMQRSQQIIETAQTKGYNEGHMKGVKSAVESMTSFAHQALVDALKNTKGVGAKLSESLLNNYTVNFNDDKRFREGIKNPLPSMKFVEVSKLTNLALLDDFENHLRDFQTQSSNYLTMQDFLSIIDSNSKLSPHVKQSLEYILASKGYQLTPLQGAASLQDDTERGDS